MFAGTCLLFSPIIAVIQWIPLVGYFFAYGFWIVIGVFAFFLTLALGSLTVGLAWVFYRPLYGLCLLAVTGVCIFLIMYDWEGQAGKTGA